jgi:hypothetical protein
MSFTPQMTAALQAAIQAGLGATGADSTYGAFDNAESNSLAGSGAFTPQQLAALQGSGLFDYGNASGEMQNKGGGNTSAISAAAQQYAQNALDPLLNAAGDSSAIGQMPSTTSPSTPSGAAIAGGYNPLQPAYLQQPATLNATTVNPSYLSSGLLNSLGSGQTIAQLQAGVAPQNQQQDQQMMQMLATAGLAPSSTAGQTAFNNLAQQQNAGIAPSIAAAIQNSQGNQLNAGQFNANAGNTGSLYNAGAMNTANAQNLQNQLAQQQYNASAYNGAGQDYFNALTGAYNNNANAFNALNSAGLSGSQGLAGQQSGNGNSLAGQTINTFPNYGSNSTLYGALGQGIGGYSPTQSGFSSGGSAGVNPLQNQAGSAGGYDAFNAEQSAAGF